MKKTNYKPSYIMLTVMLTLLITTSSTSSVHGFNVIDKCWRTDPNWRSHRQQLAKCSVGYSGKMTNNIGDDVIKYKVTDTSDDPLNPKPGTLRYAMTHIQGKIWVTFERNMTIRLQKPLLVSSFTTIDGRGVEVHIADGACLMLQRVTNVIIHGIKIHNCKAQTASTVLGPDKKIVNVGPVDGDAIRMLTSYKIWIDHNTLYDCEDGLIDVTRGSTNITISNNWFRTQNKVMLLGHDDGFLRDKNMKVTVAFNYFGPNCNQRMPRIRHGYAHVVNNVYKGWGNYAIGGSMNPSIKSQANYFFARGGRNEVTWKQESGEVEGNFQSVKDVFANGACFNGSGSGREAVRPNYTPDQAFPVEDGHKVKELTKNAEKYVAARRDIASDMIDYYKIEDEFTQNLGFVAVKQLLMKGPCKKLFLVEGSEALLYHPEEHFIECEYGTDAELETDFTDNIDKKTSRTWTWFLQLLEKSLNLKNRESVTFMSDMQKGLVDAVKNVFPLAHHRYYVRHVEANWMQRFRSGEINKLLWWASWSTYEEDFKVQLSALGALSEKVVKDLLKFNPMRWCRTYMDIVCKNQMVDNNFTESFNSWIVEPRKKPILKMLEEIRVKIMNRLKEKEIKHLQEITNNQQWISKNKSTSITESSQMLSLYCLNPPFSKSEKFSSGISKAAPVQLKAKRNKLHSDVKAE
ncbi:hypothetical protein BC332_30705 [Capsicum chinense]|nr:hypothetical protein BC332_30705 [Capsicum chinense]